MHPVKTTQKSGLAAARGAYQRSHLLFMQYHIDAFKGIKVSIIETQVPHF